MILTATLVEAGRGAIFATESSLTKEPILLPLVFDSRDLAQKFLDACERSGVELYPGISYSDMSKLYRLWFDSFKRPN